MPDMCVCVCQAGPEEHIGVQDVRRFRGNPVRVLVKEPVLVPHALHALRPHSLANNVTTENANDSTNAMQPTRHTPPTPTPQGTPHKQRAQPHKCTSNVRKHQHHTLGLVRVVAGVPTKALEEKVVGVAECGGAGGRCGGAPLNHPPAAQLDEVCTELLADVASAWLSIV